MTVVLSHLFERPKQPVDVIATSRMNRREQSEIDRSIDRPHMAGYLFFAVYRVELSAEESLRAVPENCQFLFFVCGHYTGTYFMSILLLHDTLTDCSIVRCLQQ